MLLIFRITQLLLILVLASEAYAEKKVEPRVTIAQLNEVLKVYQDVAELEVPFTQVKRLKDIPLPLEAKGRFHLVRPSTVIWEILSPAMVTVRLTVDEIEIRNGSGKDAVVQKYRRDSMPKNESRSLAALATWLTLDPEKLSADYVITKLGTQKYLFKPKNAADLPFNSMQMTVTKGGHLEHLLIDEKTGDQMELTFGTSIVVRKQL